MKTHSGKAINRAGELLKQDNLSESDPNAYDEAMDALSFWRSCHESPLDRAFELLGVSAKKVERNAVVAKRLKRTPSIIAKLQRFDKMKLRNMQDIGGCRAILSSEKKVAKLVQELKKRKSLRSKHYLKKPKEDGYRGIHLIGDFAGADEQKRSIELQIRTIIQHSWATAVEINDLFTDQAIKSNQGSNDWKVFFQSTSEQFSVIEGLSERRSQVAQLGFALADRIERGDSGRTKEELVASCEEVYLLANKLEVLKNFGAYANSLKFADQHLAETRIDGYVLLNIDTEKMNVTSRLFDRDNFTKASQEYLIAEKRAATKRHEVVALVSTDAVGGLKEAYPNYFADASNFMRLLASTINAYKYHNRSIISRAYKKLVG